MGNFSPAKARSAKQDTNPCQIDPDDVLRVLAAGASGVVALAEMLHVPTKGVSQCLKVLLERGVVSKDGIKRGTVYSLRRSDFSLYSRPPADL